MMRNTDDTAKLDHDTLADTELNAVTGGMLYLDFRPEITACCDGKTGTCTNYVTGGSPGMRGGWRC
jgi:hypothetical protein